jgi:adenylosuccinate lyase
MTDAGPGDAARLADSAMYAHLWGTPEVRAIFSERGRLQSWLDILAALARAQAAEGLIPAEAADQITANARVDLLDLELVAEQTRATGHSTLGLITALEQVLPPQAYQHIYVGATVQDLTDTWTALALRRVGGYAWRDLRRIEAALLELAETHRDTVMVGRTHGQPGSPITFGWKAASWADEVRRHLDRLREGAPRWLVGQLGGGVGTLAGHGSLGLAVRARFCAELGLADPGIAWLTARDRIAEAGGVLAMIAGTLARIGGEVYELQRPEIGELAEPPAPGVVGSITMPHKRNPERSEHLDTLARLVRANAAVLVEGMVGQHERDGRSWKAEWVALPEVCLLASQALALAVDLVEGLAVDADAMAAHVDSFTGSEAALALLTVRLGKQAARAALQQTLSGVERQGTSMTALLVDNGLLTAEEATTLRPDPGAAPAMVDFVVARARAARAQEKPEWP